MSFNYTPIDDLIKKNQPTPRISHSKEGEPVRKTSSSEINPLQEVVEHQPHPEVKPYVQVKAELPEIPPDLKTFGLQPAQTTQFPAYQNIKLPITDDKIMTGLHAPITSSFRWLATLALYLLKLAHLQLKIVHGKAVRIVRRG